MPASAPSLPVRILRRAAVLVLALVASLLPSLSQPASAQPMFASATTAFTTNPDPVHGQRFDIVGQVFLLVGDPATPFPNQTVTLERRTSTSAPWSPVGQATTVETTLSNGEKHYMFTFHRVADRTASFRVRYAGSGEAIGGSLSDDGTAKPVLVRVHRKMPIRLLQPKPSRIDLAGSVTPLFARHRVTVLRKTCAACAWRSFATPLTDSRGRYRVRLSVPRKGSHYFRARTPATNGFSQSYSPQARIRAAS